MTKRLALFLCFLCSCSSSQRRIGPPHTLPKERFMEITSEGFIRESCHDGSILRRCTEMSDRECREYAEVPIKNCVNSLSGSLGPDVRISDAGAFGAAVGECSSRETYPAVLHMLPRKKVKAGCVSMGLHQFVGGSSR
jgi:hypothetical protein